MRVFILERTILRNVGAMADAPKAGDAIVWLRAGQDPSGEAAAELSRAGISLIDGERLLDAIATNEIDAIGAAYLGSWFRKDGRDVSQLEGLSLGKSYALEFARQANPHYLMRTGEIVRRIIASYPQAEMFITDFCDGESVFRVHPDYQPLARIARHVATTLGRPLQNIASPDPLPPAFVRGKKNGWRNILASLLGGFRPAWFNARRRAKRLFRQAGPRVYMFIGRGLDLVAIKLAEAGRLKVVASALGIRGTEALRHDHLIALPCIADVAGAWKWMRHARELASHPSHSTALTYCGISYGPIVAKAFVRLMSAELGPFLVILAQTRKLTKLVDYRALIVNGAGNEPMGISTSFCATNGRSVYIVPHGINVHRSAACEPIVDQQHATYLIAGSDHRTDFFEKFLVSGDINKVVIGSPLLSLMSPMRKLRSQIHRKRLLILAFGHVEFADSARIRACDQYFIEVFKVAAELMGEGWSVTCRPHPHHPQDLEKRIAAELGLADRIVWNDSGDLNEALIEHDVVVSNLTSAYYQALYAGWPTIFYEPDYMPHKRLMFQWFSIRQSSPALMAIK